MMTLEIFHGEYQYKIKGYFPVLNDNRMLSKKANIDRQTTTTKTTHKIKKQFSPTTWVYYA